MTTTLGERSRPLKPWVGVPSEISDFMRPHLATSILLAALTKDAPTEGRLEAYRAALKPLAEATGAMITAMSAAVGVYMERLGLLPE